MNEQTTEAFFDELEKIALSFPSARTMGGAAAGAIVLGGLTGGLGTVPGALIGGYLGSKWNKRRQARLKEKGFQAWKEGYEEYKTRAPRVPTA